MRINIMGLLNWLDATFRPVDAPEFIYEIETDESGRKIFHVRDLKVWIYRNRDDWIAQGLDIGFAASGRSFEEAQERFMRGLFATIDQNLRLLESLDHLVKPAEPEYWIAWRKSVRQDIRDNGQCHRPENTLFNGSELRPQFYCSTA